MSVGRPDTATELDADIARLMRLPHVQPGYLCYWYTPVKSGYTACAGPPPEKRDLATWVYRWGPATTDLGCRDSGLREVPRYSTNLSAAWEVVDYLRQLGVWFCLFDERCDPPMYRASFCRASFLMPPCDAVEATPALAICRAALMLRDRGLKPLFQEISR